MPQILAILTSDAGDESRPTHQKTCAVGAFPDPTLRAGRTKDGAPRHFFVLPLLV
jgi:hypothetical protein